MGPPSAGRPFRDANAVRCGTLGPVARTRAWQVVGRLLPGVGVLRGYQRPWLRGDVLAGITVAAYLVPQVMACLLYTSDAADE